MSDKSDPPREREVGQPWVRWVRRCRWAPQTQDHQPHVRNVILRADPIVTATW